MISGTDKFQKVMVVLVKCRHRKNSLLKSFINMFLFNMFTRVKILEKFQTKDSFTVNSKHVFIVSFNCLKNSVKINTTHFRGLCLHSQCDGAGSATEE